MDQYLDFEQPIYTRLEKIEELKKAVPPPKNLSKELNRLEVEAEKETKKIYKTLSPVSYTHLTLPTSYAV